jgi:hypothetical protein
VPGRKAVVYISDRIPEVSGEDLFTSLISRTDFTANAGSASYLGSRGYDAAARYRAVTAHASRNRIAFYPLSPSGAGRASSQRTANYQNSLELLAQETGGRAS